jgi:hypothetical protein
MSFSPLPTSSFHRKHTGERPFTCHCGKQFSRLDNLRQHAQTVHADKQEQNERMMRDLTSLHATMAAANKAGHPRGNRRASAANGGQQQQPSLASNDANGTGIIKQEDISIGMHQRPDTSTGYEGDHNGMMYQTSANWHIQTSNMEPPRPSSRTTSSTSAASHGGSHSFRDSSQSFLAPPPSTSAAASASSQSFLSFSPSLNFGLPPDGSARPTSSGRPPTAGSDPSQPRSLPPLAAVVSASLPAPPSHQQLYAAASSPSSQSLLHQQQQQQQHILPFPPSHLRRPGTGGNRPGTAPPTSALYHPSASPGAGGPAAAKSNYYGGSGLVGSQLQLHYGRGYPADVGSGTGGYDPAPAGSESSDPCPFFFQPPDASVSPPLLHSGTAARSYPAPPTSSGGGEYDYGTDSRPQSRRLSVMELCNVDHNGASAGISAGAFLLSGGGTGMSRPGTSTGALAALALNDHERSPSSTSSSPSTISPRTRPGEVRSYAAGTDASSGGGATQEFSSGNGAGYGYGSAPGGRVSPPNRRVPAAGTGTTAGAVFRGGYSHSAAAAPTHTPSPAPYSPQQHPSSQSYSSAGAYGGFAPSPTFSTASAASSASAYGGGSPFSPRSPSFVPQSPAAPYGQQDVQYGHGHGDGGGQVRGGVRVGGHGHGHHANGAYGMRV